MKHSALAGSLAVVLFSLMNGGCASVAPPARAARAVAAPVHFDAPRDDSRESAQMAHESPAADAKGDAPAPLYPPEVVHEARIELAREALDADNQAKAEAEEAEQMQRDIAAAEASAVADGHNKRSH
jgi:hypothetical protein